MTTAQSARAPDRVGSTRNALDIQDVRFAYGGVQALAGCTFEVTRGQVTGLIGPNGAGKSTLIEIISGGMRPQAGSVLFEEQDITGAGRTRVARMGVIRTFQLSRQLERRPVLENVLLGAPDQPGERPLRAIFSNGWQQHEDDLRRRARELLEWVGLTHLEDAPANSLSGGQRRLLDIARALIARPKLLLLDEPTAGVYPALTRLIADRVRELPSLGVTVLLVAHNMSFVARACEDVVVMAAGQVLARGPLEEVRANREVVTAYLGG